MTNNLDDNSSNNNDNNNNQNNNHSNNNHNNNSSHMELNTLSHPVFRFLFFEVVDILANNISCRRLLWKSSRRSTYLLDGSAMKALAPSLVIRTNGLYGSLLDVSLI